MKTGAALMLLLIFVGQFFGAAVPMASAQLVVTQVPMRIPNDPLFGEQWYLQKIQAPEAWVQSLGFEGVTVAVIDTGVDLNHPDLKDNLWRNTREVAGNGIDDDLNGFVDDIHGWDFVNNDNDPNPQLDDQGDEFAAIHGTVAAGIIAARGDNGQGVTGVTWQTTIMALRALDANGMGESFPVVRAMDYAITNGAKVINLSFVGNMDTSLLSIAARRAYDNGVLVVAAAGNGLDGRSGVDLDSTPLYPVCLDVGSPVRFVMGVAATDREDRRAAFSNYGAGCVDISAPGVGVISTRAQDDEFIGLDDFYGGPFNGTSVSAPIVAGVAALVKAANPSLTVEQLFSILTSTATPIDGLNPGLERKLGSGRVNALAAVTKALIFNKPTEVAADGLLPTAALLPPGAKLPVLAVASGAGRAAELRLFTADGLFVRSFNPYAATFKGGVNLAIGRFAKDGAVVLVTGAGVGGGPQVRLFDDAGRVLGGFFAYDTLFRGGVSVGVGDLDGDGVDEIVTGAGPGGGPHVRIFDSRGNVKGSFFAYEQAFRAGVKVSVADVTGDGQMDIVVVPATGLRAGKVFSARGVELGSFPNVFPKTTERGNLVLLDVTGDGVMDLVSRRTVGTGRAWVWAPTGAKLGEWDELTGKFYRLSGTTLVLTGGAIRQYALGSVAGRATTVFSGFVGFAFAPFEDKFLGGAVVVPLK